MGVHGREQTERMFLSVEDIGRLIDLQKTSSEYKNAHPPHARRIVVLPSDRLNTAPEAQSARQRAATATDRQHTSTGTTENSSEASESRSACE